MENAPVERRLAAIIAMDVVGYSRLMGADEVGTLTALKAHRAGLIDPVVTAHHGRLVKTTGDGLLLEFASVVDAIACAVAMQRGMLTRNAAVPEDKRLVFRVGINIGDIIIDGGDIFGDGVNVAARLEALCEPGGICISRAANEQVRDKLSLAFADLGEHTVKNIARAVGVYGLAAKDIASLPEIPVYRPAGEGPAPTAFARKPVAIIAAALAVVLLAGGGWWFGRERESAAPALDRALAEALARSLPAAPAKLRDDVAAAYLQSGAHRAVAVARLAEKLWWTKGWPSREAAEEKALEKCQQANDEPCALIAVDDAVLPPGPDGTWPERDAPRVRYAGPFSIERVPAMRQGDLQRADVAGYQSAPAPKAMAFHANGVLRVASGAPSQRAAEEAALRACNDDPRRKESIGPCYLYAVDNRVVLPLRATEPITAALAAAPPAATHPAAATTPDEPATRPALLDGLTRIAPSLQASAREAQVSGYLAAAGHKALAAFPPSGSWRTAGWGSAELAEEHVLEGCQVRHGGPCILVAVNDRLRVRAASGDVPRRTMPRAVYDGLFDPQQIPAASDALRQRPDVAGYRAAQAPKAAAYHPWGRLFTTTGAATTHAAEERALAACNADPERNGEGGPCLLYASGDQVVLTRRATAPMNAASDGK